MTAESKTKIEFLLLVLCQGLHSVEEYMGRLWEVFPPATFVTGLISSDLEVGFIIINIGLVVFGIWCWLFPILNNYAIANALIWFWSILEIVNGLGHSLWALYEFTYLPGSATAPLLFITAAYLLKSVTTKALAE